MNEQLELIKMKCEACVINDIALVITPTYVLQLLEEIERLQQENKTLTDLSADGTRELGHTIKELERLQAENEQLKKELPIVVWNITLNLHGGVGYGEKIADKVKAGIDAYLEGKISK